MEGFCFFDVFAEKAIISFLIDGFEQSGDRCFDVADEAEIDGGAAADMLWILIDLNFLNFVSGKKFRERGNLYLA